jgi:hypothetical protein
VGDAALVHHPIQSQTTMTISLLDEIAAWKLEAKFEDVERYFFHINEMSLIENGSHCYVIGRKGTGKTAISEYLYRRVDPKIFAQKLSFKNFPFNDLYALANNSFQPPNQYITLWKYVIYSTVAKLFIRNQNIDGALRSKLAKVYTDDVGDVLQRSISRWTDTKFDVKILGSGVGGGRASTSKGNEMPWIDRVELLEDTLLKYIDDSKYLIVFDELDEDYKDFHFSEHDNSYAALLTSLFKAVQDIKARFAAGRGKVYPVIFLRDDIYATIQDADKTKWGDLTIELDWTPESIKLLLAFRISRAIDPAHSTLPFLAAWRRVFASSSVPIGTRQMRSMKIFDYITRSSQLRPRDYVKYLQECAKNTRAGQKLILPYTVKQVDKVFSNYLRSELTDEISGILPEIREIFDLVSHMRKQTFSLATFRRAFESEASARLKKIPVELVLRVLFDFSIIGNQPTQKNIQVFRYANKEARLNLNEQFCVHRGLFKALQIL